MPSTSEASNRRVSMSSWPPNLTTPRNWSAPLGVAREQTRNTKYLSRGAKLCARAFTLQVCHFLEPVTMREGVHGARDLSSDVFGDVAGGVYEASAVLARVEAMKKSSTARIRGVDWAGSF